MLEYLYLFIAGIGGGLIAGFLGGGGGIIYILILPLALHNIGGIKESELATYIVANSIFGIMFTTLFGNIAHIKLKTFYPRETIAVGISGALFSVLVIKLIVNTPYYSPLLFNVIVVLLLLFGVVQGIFEIRKRLILPERCSNKVLVGSGALAGTISGLSGLGGGIVLIPILKHWLKMDIKKAKSISLGMIFISTLAMTIFNLAEKPYFQHPFSQGLIIFSVNIPIIIGVLIASPLGVRLSHKVQSRNINVAFIIFMSIVLLKKAFDLFTSII